MRVFRRRPSLRAAATVPLALVLSLGLAGCGPPDLRGRLEPQFLRTVDELRPGLTQIRFFPSSDEFLVTRKVGQVLHFRLEGDEAVLLGQFRIPGVAPAPADLGLSEAIFHPDFASNKLLYFSFTTGDNQWNRVLQARWSTDYKDVVASIATVLEVDRVEPPHMWHGLYALAFGTDGYLYVPMGDANQPSVSQDPQSLLGKLLRIEPLEDGGYRIPGDNPFVGNDEVRDEIVAMGLRTPWRITPWQDTFFIADVGSNRYEEINHYRAPEENFGWPSCEGPCDPPRPEYKDPSIAIAREDDTFKLEDTVLTGEQQTSVSIGVVYRGGDDDPGDNDPYGGLLDNQLLFNELYQGYVRAARVSRDGTLEDSQHLFHLDAVASMDVGPDGFIYGITHFDSSIFRIILRTDE